MLTVIAVLLALVWTAPLSAQDEPELAHLTIVSATDCRDSSHLDLAAAPDGFIAAWKDAGDWLQRFGPDGTRRSVQRPVEPPVGKFVGRPSVATDPDGSGVVAWVDTAADEVYADFFDGDGQLDGDPLFLGTLPDAPSTLSLSALGDGTFALADDLTDTAVRFGRDRTVRTIALGEPYARHDFLRVGDELWHAGSRFEDPATEDRVLLTLRRLTLSGTPLGAPLATRSTAPPEAAFDTVPGVALARDGLGRISLAWIAGEAVELYRFDPSGTLLSSRPDLTRGYGIGTPAQIDLVSDREGNRLVVWDGRPGPEEPGFALLLDLIRASSILADDTPAFEDEVLANPIEDPLRGHLGGYFWQPRAALTGGGRGAVGFAGKHFPLVGLEPPCFSPDTSLVRSNLSLGGERWVLLRNGRFRVEVDWTDPFNGGSGTGHGVPGTEDAGSFWFFNPTNKEVEVKILDGRSLNGHFWVFAAGLSNVEYTITVTDQRTGETRSFFSPPREFGNFIDTAAFAADGPSATPLPALPDTPIRLSTGYSCDPRGPQLVPSAEGFLAAWGQDGGAFTRPFDDHGATTGFETSKHLQGYDLGPIPEVALATGSNGERLWAGLVAGGVSYRFVREGGLGRTEPLFELPVNPSGVELAAAALNDGSFVVAESARGRAARIDRGTEPILFDLPTIGRAPALLGVEDELWHAFITDFVGSSEAVVRVHRLAQSGGALDDPIDVSLPGTRNVRDLALAQDHRGRVYVAWLDATGVRIRVLGTDGSRRTEPALLAPPPGPGVLPPSRLDLVADAEGNALVTWVETAEDGSESAVRGATRFADGSVNLSDGGLLQTTDGSALSNPAAVRLYGGAVLVAGRLDEPGAPTPLECAVPASIVGARAPLGGEGSLLLRDGRFRVSVDWQDPFNGDDGIGHAVPGTEDAGSFWFFDRDNKEIEVKILDGRSVNGHFWVFAAGLSNVGYQITVTDQRTGRSKVYDNPPEDFGNFIDTASFPD